ncbi:putative bromodomain associated domain-containing protein [Eutypa lata UCREL1]|uniref:Transcription initiation factor TFIID subunit 8 n=1 Tax=Eutypa lata (strain UCR-EL1) TaxID=1287681 RepID=M7SBI4_EUTLA|nr:putative bromodomain associated domain-containing protein [Eutypa lata UCREL1]
MEGMSRKRSSSSFSAQREDRAKRQRTSRFEADSALSTSEAKPYDVINKPTAEDVGRDGLRRSIALTLQHVGFDSATNEALEGFTETVETYFTGFVEHLKRTANAARRDNPTPADFETILQRYNIPTSSLKPHLKNPVSKKKLVPKTYNPFTEDLGAIQSTKASMFLGPELDGNQEKESKEWIPSSFPSFPSKHSYRFTPVEAPVRDLKKKRAEAAFEARKGEEALRRIDRAAKISRQKELKELANRNPLSRQRHEALEEMMKEFIPKAGSSKSGGGMLEIADHSMIVNAGAKYLRQEVPKASRQAAH